MHRTWSCACAALGFSLLLCFCRVAIAGGSGLNVAVVVNQNSPQSIELGNYYCEKRQVPPQNLIRITWPGGNYVWSLSEYQAYLQNSLNNALALRGLTNQIDFVVLSMDIPYRILDSADGSHNSTTSALFYGFKSDTEVPPGLPPSCSLPPASSNSYAGSESLFRAISPGSGPGTFLTTMITASNLASAKAIVDRGTLGDFSFPTQKMILAKSDDVFRNVRYYEFDRAIADSRLLGTANIEIGSGLYWPVPYTNILGYQNGVAVFLAASNTLVPGAIADHLTSWGGKIFEANDQYSLLYWIDAGATASYGTVMEPCNYLAKFPSSQVYFYQARGFALAEAYYQSITNPYQGLIVGEPLAAPFARQAAGTWLNLPNNSILSGTTNLSLQWTAADARAPVQRVDLFLDGLPVQTVTNIAPRQGNIVSVSINGHAMSYTVPAGASIQSVATALAGVLNLPANRNLTKVGATLHGDRIDLLSDDLAKSASQIPITTSVSLGSATALTAGVYASRTDFLDSAARGIRSCYISNTPALGDFLVLNVTKTNGTIVNIGVTNTAGETTGDFVSRLLNQVNNHPLLKNPDGLTAEDIVSYASYGMPLVEFNLRPNNPGWQAAQIQIELTGSPSLITYPAGTPGLAENQTDLQPRNHLYVTAGLQSLPVTFAFETSAQASGFHELSAVAYEGTHVRAQKRVSRTVRIQNHPLAAALTLTAGGITNALEGVLQFTVAGNAGNISRIELFSTGGSLSIVSNQSSTTFSVAATNLGVGLHPFYAQVSALDGRRYQTETLWLRVIGAEPPFRLTATANPIKLTWASTALRNYEVLTSGVPAGPFQVAATVIAQSNQVQWLDPAPSAASRFYRVRTGN